jgi:hypothetical protein
MDGGDGLDAGVMTFSVVAQLARLRVQMPVKSVIIISM